MSLPERVRARYRTELTRVGETVTVRRYAGKGPARAVAQEAAAKCRIVGYQPSEIVGAVQQGDRKVILLIDPTAAVASGQVALSTMLPLTSDDKLVISGREVAIQGVDDQTRSIQGVVIALEIQVRG
ncbi:hypothetical protein ABH973_006705 [Bradyrhizobium ottawaense]|uniref:hypothetical protein n=1 Tax=Bradyrhizobium ottawaense TaxID=931866 RepID=UPI003514BF8A